MEFYISWWNGDPLYQFYDTNCNMLINVSKLSKKWSFINTNNLTHSWYINTTLILPKKLMVSIDITEHSDIDEALSRQIELIKNVNINKIFFLHPDVRVGTKNNSLFNKNIQNAKDYLSLFNSYKTKLPFLKDVELIGVVHGWNISSIKKSAKRLVKIGYAHIALGNKESISKFDRTKIAKELKALKNVGAKYIHLLGVSSFDLFKNNPELKAIIDSIDSSTPINESKDNGIYFSQVNSPLNGTVRFKVCSKRLWLPLRKVPWINQYGFAGIICVEEKNTCSINCKAQTSNTNIVSYTQVICDCPTCEQHGVQEGLLKLGEKKYNNRRAIHNYYHIKKELDSLVGLSNKFNKRSNPPLMP